MILKQISIKDERVNKITLLSLNEENNKIFTDFLGEAENFFKKLLSIENGVINQTQENKLAKINIEALKYVI